MFSGAIDSHLDKALNLQLETWLDSVRFSETYQPPIEGCKAIIAPHAGFSYSGPAAAWAYKSIDVSGITTIFILGPSHHFYLDSCAISSCREYLTPLGPLRIDTDIVRDLKKHSEFQEMSLDTDEDEHSIEMHLPFLRKIFHSEQVKIIPILVGAIKRDKEIRYGQLLAPYLSRSDTLFVVSSDFCHWGTRFSYTRYYPSSPPSSAVTLTRSNAKSTISPEFPIFQSISALDHEAMDILALPGESQTAARAHERFSRYLAETKNTICGRHPIGVLLATLAEMERQTSQHGDTERNAKLQWVRYEQSSECRAISDSSVSYASAFVMF